MRPDRHVSAIERYLQQHRDEDQRQDDAAAYGHSLHKSLILPAKRPDHGCNCQEYQNRQYALKEEWIVVALDHRQGQHASEKHQRTPEKTAEPVMIGGRSLFPGPFQQLSVGLLQAFRFMALLCGWRWYKGDEGGR